MYFLNNTLVVDDKLILYKLILDSMFVILNEATVFWCGYLKEAGL